MPFTSLFPEHTNAAGDEGTPVHTAIPPTHKDCRYHSMKAFLPQHSHPRCSLLGGAARCVERRPHHRVPTREASPSTCLSLRHHSVYGIHTDVNFAHFTAISISVADNARPICYPHFFQFCFTVRASRGTSHPNPNSSRERCPIAEICEE